MVYMPTHFEVTDPEVMAEIMAAAPLATIVTRSGDDLVADHIPLLYRPTEHTLIGHVARANPMWEADQGGHEVLAIFQATEAYISPTWYPSKQEHHEVVPTWNYAVVHAHGRLVIHDDEKWVRGMVGRLTRTMEAPMLVPWKMADAPRPFIDDQLRRIVGIEIEVSRLTCKLKASQNRSYADRASVIEGLTTTGDSQSVEMAGYVRRGTPTS